MTPSAPHVLFARLAPDALAHGYLFTGPAGVGKKTFAKRLAQSLLCTAPQHRLLEPCGACSACTQVAAGTHPDVYVAEGQVKIGDRDGGGFHDAADATARDLVRQLALHSYAGGKRIFILGDADFTREAANALLKFFEEPPPDVLLVVTSATPGRILPTIRSRLVEVVFPRLRDAEVERILVERGFDAAAAALAARAADGSVTRALAVLDDAEGATRDAVVTWFLAAAHGAAADSTWATRAALESGLETIKTLARDWVALSLGENVPLLAADARGRLEALPRRDPQEYVRLLAAIGDAERLARTNVTPALVADLVRMALAPAPGSVATSGA